MTMCVVVTVRACVTVTGSDNVYKVAMYDNIYGVTVSDSLCRDDSESMCGYDSEWQYM